MNAGIHTCTGKMKTPVPVRAYIFLVLRMPRSMKYYHEQLHLLLFLEPLSFPTIDELPYFPIPRYLENFWCDDLAEHRLKCYRHIVYFYVWEYYYGLERAKDMAYGPRNTDGKKVSYLTRA